MIYGPCIDLWSWGHVLWKVVLYDTPDQTSQFQFFIAKSYGEEAHIVEIISSKKLDIQLFRKCQDLS